VLKGAIIRLAAEVAGLKFGKDIVVDLSRERGGTVAIPTNG
jgi:hypothetical protein